MIRCCLRIYGVSLLNQEITPHAQAGIYKQLFLYLFWKKKNWFALEKKWTTHWL